MVHSSLRDVIFLTDYQAFLANLKPAYLTDFEDQSIHLLKAMYPSFTLTNETIMFFQDVQSRDKFAESMQGVEIYSREYYRNIGLALGYPPIAVEFFLKFMENREELEPISAAYDYAGRYFGGRLADAIPIAEWLWANVPIPPSEVKITTAAGKEYRLSPNL